MAETGVRIPVAVLGALRAVSLPSRHQAGRPERAQGGGRGAGCRSDRGAGEQPPNPSACVEESCPHRCCEERIVNLALDPL
jgi:hypothetical protein